MELTATLQKRFLFYKDLAEKAFAQLSDSDISRRPDEGSNSIAIVVKHICGNMRSRFTDFRTTDGEKPWRNRDTEFENAYSDKATMLADWESAWQILDEVFAELTDDDLEKTVTIRGEAHSIFDALLRQVAHYAYHIGQIVFIAKNLRAEKWQSLSIPRGKSAQYNSGMMPPNESASPVCFANSAEVRDDYKDE
ncbi:MAG: DUF1572 domain-containing protein [Chryseobacterium sp.]|nr:MAG: DUF1572 domain-containing protein [Chryseobacterium sp.]